MILVSLFNLILLIIFYACLSTAGGFLTVRPAPAAALRGCAARRTAIAPGTHTARAAAAAHEKKSSRSLPLACAVLHCHHAQLVRTADSTRRISTPAFAHGRCRRTRTRSSTS